MVKIDPSIATNTDTYNLSTQEAEVGRLPQDQDYARLHSEFYSVRHCLKKKGEKGGGGRGAGGRKEKRKRWVSPCKWEAASNRDCEDY